MSRDPLHDQILRRSFNRSDSTVRDFYADTGGRMANPELFTLAVKQYHEAEERALAQLTAKFRHLVEVGCGFGRLRGWARARGLDYDGVDLVATPDAAPGSRLHRASVEEIGAHVEAGSGSLVFLPFNCFGNLARVHAAVLALGRLRCTVAISTFLPVPEATQARLIYYAQCGYSELVVTESDDVGVLITGKEGLSSFAFNKPALRALAHFGGLGVEQLMPLTQIATLVVLTPEST